MYDVREGPKITRNRIDVGIRINVGIRVIINVGIKIIELRIKNSLKLRDFRI